jgi:hypothetical protein
MYEKVKTIYSLTIVIVMSLFFTDVSQGQGIKGGMGYFMFGGSTIDIEALNSRLEDKGYSKISPSFISLGGGGHGIIGRWIMGGEGCGLIGREVTSKGYKTSIEAGYGFFSLGYIVYSKEALRVYPLLGLGGGRMSLNIVEKGTSPSFDEVLDNPKRGIELSTGGFLLNLALGTDYLLGLTRDEEGEGGLIFGLRGGYIFAPLKDEWEMDGVDISGPDVGITGSYIRLMIGGGGFGIIEK